MYIFGPGRVPKHYDGCSCCYPFRKMPKALLIRNRVTKLRIHIRDIIPDRSTVLDFYQMAPPSGSVVPFVLVITEVEGSAAPTARDRFLKKEVWYNQTLGLQD